MPANDQTPVWFITGCSTGFGLELAKLVLARGWRAVLTARKPETLADLAAEHPNSALVLKLWPPSRRGKRKASARNSRRTSLVCWL